MQGVTGETVGEKFSEDLLQKARDLTLQIIEAVAAKIEPGVSEAVAKAMIENYQQTLGAERNWHPPQIRFGSNTLLPFGVPGAADSVLGENDIFFFDIGPVFKGHEGDVGRSYSVGTNSEMHRCATDVEKIWHLVREQWLQHNTSGVELYKFAETAAKNLGWILSFNKANGHRIADFPHIAKRRGSVQDFPEVPVKNRWILEIQIRHPALPFGAFYEDLLN